MVENKEFEKFLTAYRQGAMADFIQPQQNGRWGSLWTFPPCDPAAAERAGRQMARMGATNIRWIRRARLRDRMGGSYDALVALTLPNEQQDVIILSTGKVMSVDSLLIDESFSLLKAAFMAELTGLS
jgi:hypothetical protein